MLGIEQMYTQYTLFNGANQGKKGVFCDAITDLFL